MAAPEWQYVARETHIPNLSGLTYTLSTVSNPFTLLKQFSLPLPWRTVLYHKNIQPHPPDKADDFVSYSTRKIEQSEEY